MTSLLITVLLFSIAQNAGKANRQIKARPFDIIRHLLYDRPVKRGMGDEQSSAVHANTFTLTNSAKRVI
jgi:hypothetical protein